jgi:hypothetical protein
MKISEFRKVEEGFFSDLAGSFRGLGDPKKDDKAVATRAASLFQKDFIKDFYADLKKALDANTVAVTLGGDGFTQAEIDRIRPSVEKMKANGKINNATELDAWLDAKFPKRWSNTQDKNQVLNDLMTSKPNNSSNFSPQRAFNAQDIARLRPSVDSLRASGKINNPTELGAWLAKTYPTNWKLTQDKGKVLNSLMGAIPESVYYRTFNTLVESYIAEQTAEPMDQWVMRWFAAYMQGLDWEGSKADAETIAKSIVQTYDKDSGKAGVNQLANLAWKITASQKEIPRGARNIQAPTSSSGVAAINLTKQEWDDLVDKAAAGDADAIKKVKAARQQGNS